MAQTSVQNVHETLARYILADGLDPIFDSEKSHGAYLVDARTGKEFLDLFSFFATQPLGFNHPKMNTSEFRTKLAKHALMRPTLADVYTVEYAQFVETFGKVAGRGHFRYFFFVEGGSLGVENALKIAFDWKVRKNLKAGRGEKGHQVIHFREAFHGRSGYTLSLTNTFDPRKHQYFPKFSWPRITNPKLRFPLTDQSLQETIRLEKTAVDEIQKALRDHLHDVAAIIIEPIQAEGGDNHFRPEFLRELRRIADENDILLIFDEVQTGLGLTGKMWAFEHFGVTPDVISFGKKAQVGGCAATTRIDDVAENVFHTPSRINSTWGGNLVDMIRSQRYLEIIEEDRLLENVTSVGRYLLTQLEKVSNEHPRISNVRGRGFMVAFDLPSTELRDEMRRKMNHHGAIILPCGPVSLRFRPHLDFTREVVDHAIDIIKKSENDL